VSYAGLLRKKFSWLFDKIEKYLHPDDFERFRSLEEKRYGERHQDLYVFYMLNGAQALRYIAKYLGRSKSSIARSNQVLEDLGLVVLKHGKFNFFTGKRARNKILEGADGLKSFRKNEQEKVREKRREYNEKYGNGIQRLVDKAVQKTGGTKIPMGKKEHSIYNLQYFDLPNFYLELFQHFTPAYDSEPLPSPEERKRWKIYCQLAEEHPKFRKNPITWAKKKVNDFKFSRRGYQLRKSNDPSVNVWINKKTGDIEFVKKNGPLCKIKRCLQKILHYENSEFQQFRCFYRGEFGQVYEETLRIKKLMSPWAA